VPFRCCPGNRPDPKLAPREQRPSGLPRQYVAPAEVEVRQTLVDQREQQRGDRPGNDQFTPMRQDLRPGMVEPVPQCRQAALTTAGQQSKADGQTIAKRDESAFHHRRSRRPGFGWTSPDVLIAACSSANTPVGADENRRPTPTMVAMMPGWWGVVAFGRQVLERPWRPAWPIGRASGGTSWPSASCLPNSHAGNFRSDTAAARLTAWCRTPATPRAAARCASTTPTPFSAAVPRQR